ADAILALWYPGEAGGTALADTLAGANNPSGRLPVTFYRSTGDLPAFIDYGMKERTYRYFSGQPLWGFGHGLSYTRFGYSGAAVRAGTTGEPVTVTVQVTNT
ncbi:glycoside hydrolase family 3 protein, partial [Klebsiella michiganensis]|nr:glycoside hydrolase family 3 protein [Klebsiella michiganensis]